MNASINAALFKKARFLKITLPRLGIMRKVSLPAPPDADPARFKHAKQIIVSGEYDAIAELQNETKAWCLARSMPSCILPGLFAVSVDEVANVTARLEASKANLAPRVEALVKAWPRLVENARLALNGSFNAADYLPAERVPSKFDITYNWLQLDVPEGLPPEIRKQEEAKLRKQFEDAQKEIIEALREGFAALVDHAVDKLSTKPGEKQKIFRDSLVENFTEFFDTFNARNLMQDEELSKVVAQARNIMGGIGAQTLRESGRARQTVVQKLTEVQAVMDTLLTERKSRKFDLAE